MTMTTLLECFPSTASFTSSKSEQLPNELSLFFSTIQTMMSSGSFTTYQAITINLTSVLLHFRSSLQSHEPWQIRVTALVTAAFQLRDFLKAHSRYLIGISAILPEFKRLLSVATSLSNTDIVHHSSPFGDNNAQFKAIWAEFVSYVTNKTLSSLVSSIFGTIFSDKSADFPGKDLFASFTNDLSYSLSNEFKSISRGNAKSIPALFGGLVHSASLWIKKKLGFEDEYTLQLNTQFVHITQVANVFTTFGPNYMETKLNHLVSSCDWVSSTFRRNDAEVVRDILTSKINALIADVTSVIESRSLSDTNTILSSIATWKNILASLDALSTQIRGAKSNPNFTCNALTIIGAPGVGKTDVSELYQVSFMQGYDLATTGKLNFSYKEFLSLNMHWSKQDVKYSSQPQAWTITCDEVGSTNQEKVASSSASEIPCPRAEWAQYILEMAGNVGGLRLDGADIKDKGKNLDIKQVVGTTNEEVTWPHITNPHALNRRNTTVMAATNPSFSSRQNETRVDYTLAHMNRQEGHPCMCQLLYTSNFSDTTPMKQSKSGTWNITYRQTPTTVFLPSRDLGPGDGVLSDLYLGLLRSFTGDAGGLESASSHTPVADFSAAVGGEFNVTFPTSIMSMVNPTETRTINDRVYNAFEELQASAPFLVHATATQAQMDKFRSDRPHGLCQYSFGTSHTFPYVSPKSVLYDHLTTSVTSGSFLDTFRAYLDYVSGITSEFLIDIGPYATAAFLLSSEFRDCISQSPYEVYTKMTPTVSLSPKDSKSYSPDAIWVLLKDNASRATNWSLTPYFFSRSYVASSLWKIKTYGGVVECMSKPKTDFHSKMTACSGYHTTSHSPEHMRPSETAGKWFCDYCQKGCDEAEPHKPKTIRRSPLGNLESYEVSASPGPVSLHASVLDSVYSKASAVKSYFIDSGNVTPSSDLAPNLMEMDAKVYKHIIGQYFHFIYTQPRSAMAIFLNFPTVCRGPSQPSQAPDITTFSGLARFIIKRASGDDCIPSAYRYDDSSPLTSFLFPFYVLDRITGGWRALFTSSVVGFYTYGPFWLLPILFRLLSFLFCVFILFTCPAGRICFVRWFNVCSQVVTQALTTKISSLTSLTSAGVRTKDSHVNAQPILCEDVDFPTFSAYIDKRCSAAYEKLQEEIYTFERPDPSWGFICKQFLSLRFSGAVGLLFEKFVFRRIAALWMPISRYVSRRLFVWCLYTIAPPGMMANIYFASIEKSVWDESSDLLVSKSCGVTDHLCHDLHPGELVNATSVRTGFSASCSQILRSRFLALCAHNAKLDSKGEFYSTTTRPSLDTASCHSANTWVLYYFRFVTLSDIPESHRLDCMRASALTVEERFDYIQGDYILDAVRRNLSMNIVRGSFTTGSVHALENGTSINNDPLDYVRTVVSRIVTDLDFGLNQSVFGQFVSDITRLSSYNYDKCIRSCKLINVQAETFFHHSSCSNGVDKQPVVLPKFVARVVPPTVGREFLTYLMTGAGIFAFYRIIKMVTAVEKSTKIYHSGPSPDDISHVVSDRAKDGGYSVYVDTAVTPKVLEKIRSDNEEADAVDLHKIPRDAASIWRQNNNREKATTADIPAKLVTQAATWQDTVASVGRNTYKIMVPNGGVCQIAVVNRIHTNCKAIVFLGNAHATDLESGVYPMDPKKAGRDIQVMKELVQNGICPAYPLQIFSKGNKPKSFRLWQNVEECKQFELVKSPDGDAALFFFYFDNTAAREGFSDSTFKSYMPITPDIDIVPMFIGRSVVCFVPATGRHADSTMKNHVPHPTDNLYIIDMTITGTFANSRYGSSFVCKCQNTRHHKIFSPGDSGSPIFMYHNARYVPFGIHTGVSTADDDEVIITPIFNGSSVSWVDLLDMLKSSQSMVEMQSSSIDPDDRNYLLCRNLVTYSSSITPPDGSLISPDDPSPRFNHPDNELLNAIRQSKTTELVALSHAERMSVAAITKTVFRPYGSDQEYESAGWQKSKQYSQLSKPLITSVQMSGYDYYSQFADAEPIVFDIMKKRCCRDYLSLRKNDPTLPVRAAEWNDPISMKLLPHNSSSSAGSKITMNDGGVLKYNSDFKQFSSDGSVHVTRAFSDLVDHVSSETKLGYAPFIPARIFGKSETRKKNKAMRGVNNESAPNRVAVNNAMRPLTAIYETSNLCGEFCHGVGADLSVGLPQQIRNMGGENSIGVSCDYSEYDARVPPAIKDLALRVNIWLYSQMDLLSSDPDERFQQINQYAAQTHSLRVPQTNANGAVFTTAPGVPSGHPATTIFNCFCNLILNHSFIIMSLRSRPERILAYNYLLQDGVWDKVIFFLCYGDDSVFALKDSPESHHFAELLVGEGGTLSEAIHVLDLPTYASKLGMVLTDDRKEVKFNVKRLHFSQDPVKFEWSFCSRFIVTYTGIDGNPSVHAAVLARSNISKCFHFLLQTPSHVPFKDLSDVWVEQLSSKFESMLREVAFYGLVEYVIFLKKFLHFTTTVTLPSRSGKVAGLKLVSPGERKLFIAINWGSFPSWKSIMGSRFGDSMFEVDEQGSLTDSLKVSCTSTSLFPITQEFSKYVSMEPAEYALEWS